MKERILLVDDDLAVRRMLFRVLTDEEYAVTTAACGAEALERAGQIKIDLVLLDLNLPKEDGWRTFERLTTDYPLVPVIVITARPNQLFPALSAGAGALMEKPLDLPRLLRTIRDLLDETIDSRRARIAGRPAEFHYLPPKQPEQFPPVWKPAKVHLEA